MESSKPRSDNLNQDVALDEKSTNSNIKNGPPWDQPEVTKFHTSCMKEHDASLECIYENYQDKSKCADFFEKYKECRKEEHRRILEERLKSRRSFF